MSLGKIEAARQNEFTPHNSLIIINTDGGTRTRTPFRITDFKSVASTIPPRRLLSMRIVAQFAKITSKIMRWRMLRMDDFARKVLEVIAAWDFEIGPGETGKNFVEK